MYSSYSMPNYAPSMQKRGFGLRSNRNPYNNGDRFIGGGFVVPFVLGGITGSLLTRPNFYGSYPPPQPYPVPMPYYVGNPYPTYTENYYYY